MKKIDYEIEEIKKTIEIKQQVFESFSRNNKNEDLLEKINGDILSLKRKLGILEEKKNTGIYVAPKPELGDQRYNKFFHKTALDILRVLYYDVFRKDPSISFVSNNRAFFTDDTLPIYGASYSIKGQIPFEIMLQTPYKNYNPSENYSVGIRINKKYLLDEIKEDYFYLMSTLINKYTNNQINFICGDYFNENEIITLSYIADRDFYHYDDNFNTKRYYEFFNLLCDNNHRNIIYIGDTMKQNAKLDEIEKVYSDFVVPDMNFIANKLGLNINEIQNSNENIKKLILSPRKK